MAGDLFTVVQQGRWRGKKIPLPPSHHGHRHVTSSILKEAFFQLAEAYYPCAFFDLCAGSGQMALEAVSRGYGPVHAVELDEGRFRFLIGQLSGHDITFHKKDFRRMAASVAAQTSVVFIDVPYSYWTADGQCSHIETFLQKLSIAVDELPVEQPNQIFIGIQSPMPVQWKKSDWLGRFRIDAKKYRGHSLTLMTIG